MIVSYSINSQNLHETILRLINTLTSEFILFDVPDKEIELLACRSKLLYEMSNKTDRR